MMKWEAEEKGYTCNDCFLSMHNCHDMSICCEDETGLCDYFEEMDSEREERDASMIEAPKDRISYAVICEKFPDPCSYFESYELAKRWLKLEQPNNKPHYIVKCTEHFEICNSKQAH